MAKPNTENMVNKLEMLITRDKQRDELKYLKQEIDALRCCLNKKVIQESSGLLSKELYSMIIIEQ
jgi:hypothetical protein